MAVVQLTHPMVTKIKQTGVFDNLDVADLVESLCKSIFAHSIKVPLDRIVDEDDDPKSSQKTFRGDAFEIFGEFLCAAFENDKRLGIRRGEMIPLAEDVGVDLRGESTVDGNPVAVQFKFKSDRNYVFTLRELATWLAASGHIMNASGRNLVLITTGKQVNHKVMQVVPNVRVINRNLLKRLVDKNTGFYADFLASLDASERKPQTRAQRELYPDQQMAANAIGAFLDA